MLNVYKVTGFQLYNEFKNAFSKWLFEPGKETESEYKQAMWKLESWIKDHEDKEEKR